jgi:hypothetical protein
MALSVLAQFSVIGKIALPGLIDAERSAALDRLQRAKTAVEASRRSLDDFARDWAAWQDTAAFLADPVADYPFAELVTGTLLAEDIDLFGLYDKEGNLLWGALPERRLASIAIDAEGLEEFLSRDAAKLMEKDRSSSGVTTVSDRAAFYSVKPVAYEAYGAGVVGYLAMLRFIDGAAITEWERLVGGALQVVPVVSGEEGAGEAGGKIESMRVGLKGPDGRPAFWLEIDVVDDYFHGARASLREAMNYTLMVGGVTFFVLLVGMQQLVLRPLSRLTREVLSLMPEERSFSMKRLAVRGRDETSVIASEINGLLDRLEKSAADSNPGPHAADSLQDGSRS